MADRGRFRIALVVVAMAATVVSTAATPTGDRPFGGIVVDPLGRALERVEVYFVPEHVETPATRTVLTDEHGRFLLDDLVPAAYRIVVVKEGFAVFFDRVHTGLRSTLDVVLHPLPVDGEPGSESVTDDAAWALRVPRRSIWQDIAPAPIQPVEVVYDASSRRASAWLTDALEGRVDQVFAVAAPSAAGWSGDLQGSETRMALAGNVGERARVELGGRYATIEAGADDPTTPSAQSSRDETAFRVDVRYQAAPTDRIEVAAYWLAHDALVSAATDPTRPLRQADRIWGYRAGWTRQLDDGSRVSATTEYSEAALTLPDPEIPAAMVAMTATDGQRRHRAIATGGAYERLSGGDHQTRFALNARFVDAGLPALRFAADGALYARLDRPGWDLEARAEDLWTPGGPISWVYGADYRHRVTPFGDAAIAVPRAGAIWSGKLATVRVVMSRPTIARRSPAAGTERPDLADARRGGTGYEASIESELVFGLRVRGTATYAPVGASSLEGPTSTGGGVPTRPMFVFAGDVASSEQSLSLFREGPRVSASIDWIRGDLEGSLSAVLPYGLPFHALRPSAARYRIGRLGVHVPASGTHVRLEHREVAHASPSSVAESIDALAHRGLELRVIQDMLRYPGSAWRLLVSLESAEVGEAEVAYVSRLEGERLPDAVRRVNAGVSVAF